MELTLFENIVVLYWYLLDVRAFQEFNYWKAAGLQTTYAFKKVFKKL